MPGRHKQLAWQDDPIKLERIVQAWELYIQRTPLKEIGKRLGCSARTAGEDVSRARTLIRSHKTALVEELLDEAVAVRSNISSELWETLKDLRERRGQVVSESSGDKGKSHSIEGPAAQARAEADVLRAVMANEAELEELLGLRKKQGDVHLNDNRSLVVIDQTGVVRKFLPPGQS